MFINNHQAVEILGITDSDLKQFKAYDHEYDRYFSTSETKTLEKSQANLTVSA